MRTYKHTYIRISPTQQIYAALHATRPNRISSRCAEENWSHSYSQTQETLMPKQDIKNYFLQNVFSFRLHTLHHAAKKEGNG